MKNVYYIHEKPKCLNMKLYPNLKEVDDTKVQQILADKGLLPVKACKYSCDTSTPNHFEDGVYDGLNAEKPTTTPPDWNPRAIDKIIKTQQVKEITRKFKGKFTYQHTYHCSAEL